MFTFTTTHKMIKNSSSKTLNLEGMNSYHMLSHGENPTHYRKNRSITFFHLCHPFTNRREFSLWSFFFLLSTHLTYQFHMQLYNSLRNRKIKTHPDVEFSSHLQSYKNKFTNTVSGIGDKPKEAANSWYRMVLDFLIALQSR